MSLVILPVDSASPYYRTETRIDGESYRLTLRWNQTSETWYLDIEGLTVDLHILGIALIVGSDLLRPFAILELGSLYVVDLENRDENPTREGLGDRFRLVHLSRGETVEGLLAEVS